MFSVLSDMLSGRIVLCDIVSCGLSEPCAKMLAGKLEQPRDRKTDNEILYVGG